MKIYTRTGDDGSTGTFSGERLSKDHPRIEATGAVDELNSHLGVAISCQPADPVAEALRRVQSDLFALGVDLTSSSANFSEAGVAWLEQEIDRMTAQLEPLRNFILPGGSPAAAQIHVARTVCRRAERRVITLGEHEAVSPVVKIYLNRLSDFLFTLARSENHLRGIAEPKWVG